MTLDEARRGGAVILNNRFTIALPDYCDHIYRVDGSSVRVVSEWRKQVYTIPERKLGSYRLIEFEEFIL